jgi:chemotaxis signal transduction protein
MRQERWFCLFHGDAGPMAVPAESVAEVLDTDRLVRLAWSPPQVAGLCPFHREVVPVVRLAASPRGGGTDPSSEPDPSAGERHDVDDQARCILLILRTEHGAWGIRSDAAGTIMSRECPEYQPPQADGEGPVQVGTILREGTRYGVLDAEATWLGLRSAIGRWYGTIGEPEISLPIAPGGERPEPLLMRRAESGESERCRGEK